MMRQMSVSKDFIGEIPGRGKGKESVKADPMRTG